MKNIVKSALLSLLCASASFAATPMAERTVVGGFMPRTAPTRMAIQILTDGSIVEVNRFHDGHVTTRVLGALSPEIRGKVAAEAARFEPSEMVLENPEAPMCADAPTIKTIVYNQHNQPVVIGQNADCRRFQRADGKSSAIVQILDGLVALTYLDVVYE